MINDHRRSANAKIERMLGAMTFFLHNNQHRMHICVWFAHLTISTICAHSADVQKVVDFHNCIGFIEIESYDDRLPTDTLRT